LRGICSLSLQGQRINQDETSMRQVVCRTQGGYIREKACIIDSVFIYASYVSFFMPIMICEENFHQSFAGGQLYVKKIL
jgi:hypothetical protein